MELTANRIREVLKDLHLVYRTISDSCDPQEYRTMLSDRLEWVLEAAADESRAMPFCRAAKASIDMAFHWDELQFDLRNAFAEIEQWALDAGAAQVNIAYEGEFVISADKVIIEESETTAKQVKTPSLPILTRNDEEILQALYELGSTETRAFSREQILTRAGWTSEGKHAFKRLLSSSLVCSHRGVGYSLTLAGQAKAVELAART